MTPQNCITASHHFLPFCLSPLLSDAPIRAISIFTLPCTTNFQGTQQGQMGITPHTPRFGPYPFPIFCFRNQCSCQMADAWPNCDRSSLARHGWLLEWPQRRGCSTCIKFCSTFKIKRQETLNSPGNRGEAKAAVAICTGGVGGARGFSCFT